MGVQRIVIQPTYKKDNGLWVLDTQHIPFPETFTPKEQAIIYIPPGQIGGNHKHPRVEAFIGIGKDLQLIWQDQEGILHNEQMNPDEQLQLFIIPSMLPHAVINTSKDSFTLLYEYADDKQHDVEVVKLY